MLKSSHHKQPPEYQQQQIYEQKTNRYAEDFIKHVSNVKRRSQNIPFDGTNVLINTPPITTGIYEVPKLNPKRLEMEPLRNENDNNNLTSDIVDEQGIRDSEKMLMHVESDKTYHSEKNHVKATGTVPKLSSSISSNESKKKSGQRCDRENKQKELSRNQANESESLLKAKVLQGKGKTPMDEKMLSNETLSTTLEMKATDMPKSDGKNAREQDLQSKNEQQKNIDANDDDDDVFLESHPSKATQECQASETKTVSAISYLVTRIKEFSSKSSRDNSSGFIR